MARSEYARDLPGRPVFGWMPRCERRLCHPHRQAAALLERPVVLWPVGYLVARLGDLVTARLIGLVGHRSSSWGRGNRPYTPMPGLAEATDRDLCTKAPAVECAFGLPDAGDRAEQTTCNVAQEMLEDS
jgi:hypothetical protein